MMHPDKDWRFENKMNPGESHIVSVCQILRPPVISWLLGETLGKLLASGPDAATLDPFPKSARHRCPADSDNEEEVRWIQQFAAHLVTELIALKEPELLCAPAEK